jgi:hypothetical protein
MVSNQRRVQDLPSPPSPLLLCGTKFTKEWSHSSSLLLLRGDAIIYYILFFLPSSLSSLSSLYIVLDEEDALIFSR